jgi:Mg2+ and Co2+ transporter CorA
MESRAYELDNIMDGVRVDVDIAIEKYGRIIEAENTANSDKLNKIMAVFTLFSISCLPASIIGGLFGMNVKVPYMVDEENDNHVAFALICITVVLTGILLFMFLRWWLIRAE